MRNPTPSRARLFVARVRMPLVAVAVAGFVVAAVLDLPRWLELVVVGTFVVALAVYARFGTPAGPVADLASPVRGRWRALNSPTSRVPSHWIHGWAQTYALDLVFDPSDGSRPGVAWVPLARRPGDFPGFGQPVRSPLAGEVVRARAGWRDHWSRTSPAGLVYLVAEGVRELAGPSLILGNHLVVRGGDGTCVVLAHLRRRSLRVRRGDHVEAGQVVAECGNSGNSSEPHLHIQAMDHPSVWIASARPLRINGAPPPANGTMLAQGAPLVSMERPAPFHAD
ncbi:MAG: M23 family metallopeptidase [Acidimicrobiales bacterium]